jgi:hypothetical protein
VWIPQNPLENPQAALPPKTLTRVVVFDVDVNPRHGRTVLGFA